MIKTLTLYLVLFTATCFCQTAEYGKLTKNNQSFTEYITKKGDIIKVGDTLIIGTPLDPNGFRHIIQGNIRVHPTHSGKSFEVHKIKSYGKQKSGFLAWLSFKGYGLLPVDVDLENALATGEVINPNGTPSKEQALNKIKEQKELLDLEIITQEEYDNVKNEMSKYLK